MWNTAIMPGSGRGRVAEALTQAETEERRRTERSLGLRRRTNAGKEGRTDGLWNGCAVEAAGNQLSKKGQTKCERKRSMRDWERGEWKSGVDGEVDTTQRAICKCCTLIAKGNIEMIAYIVCELNAIYIKNLFKVVQFAKHQKLNMQIEERKRTLPHTHTHTCNSATHTSIEWQEFNNIIVQERKLKSRLLDCEIPTSQRSKKFSWICIWLKYF